MRKRNPRHAATRANVDERSVERPHELDTAQRVVQQHAPRLLEIANRRQAGRRNEGAEPAAKQLVRVSGPVEGVWGNRKVPPASTITLIHPERSRRTGSARSPRWLS